MNSQSCCESRYKNQFKNIAVYIDIEKARSIISSLADNSKLKLDNLYDYAAKSEKGITIRNNKELENCMLEILQYKGRNTREFFTLKVMQVLLALFDMALEREQKEGYYLSGSRAEKLELIRDYTHKK